MRGSSNCLSVIAPWYDFSQNVNLNFHSSFIAPALVIIREVLHHTEAAAKYFCPDPDCGHD